MNAAKVLTLPAHRVQNVNFAVRSDRRLWNAELLALRIRIVQLLFEHVLKAPECVALRKKDRNCHFSLLPLFKERPFHTFFSAGAPAPSCFLGRPRFTCAKERNKHK